MWRPLPAYPLYCAYCLIVRGLRAAYWTAGVYFYISVVGLDPFRLVIVGTALEVVILLGEVPTGIVADVYSRRLSVILGVALMGAGFAFDGAVGAFWATLVAQLIWGLGATFTSGALGAWIADELGGRDLERVYLRGAQYASAGALLGIGVGVGLSYAGLALTMILAGAALVAFAGFLVAVMPERGFAPVARGTRGLWPHFGATLRAGGGVVRGSGSLLACVGLVVLWGMGSESFDRLWEVHLLGIGLPSMAGMTPVAWFGLVNAGGLLLSIGAAEVMRRRGALGAPRTLLRRLLVLTGLITVGMLAFGAARSFLAAVAAYWFTLLLRQLVPPLIDAWLVRQTPSAVRATVLSFVGQADAAGQIAGGPIFGWIASAHSTGLALAAAGLSLLPGIPLLLRALRADAPVTGD
jgi:DHA3 family tetracycline resistance protein-like MFS transporter